MAGTYLANLWNSDSLWQLNRLLWSRNIRVRNPRLQQWLAEYYKGDNRRGQWPDAESPSPQCGISKLDATLAQVWRVWLAVVRQSKKHGPDREQLNRLLFGENRIARLEQDQDPWPLELLGRLDSDHWAASLAQGAYSKAETISELPEPERSREAETLNRTATNDILDEVDADVRNRTHVIGLMRPRSEASQSAFTELVKEAVIKRFSALPARSPISTLSKTQPGQLVGQIILSWASLPKDLDLHLKILSKGQAVEVSYSNKGNISADPWVLLNQDFRDGRGPEIIQITRWLDGTYRCAVHNYSGDAPLASCGATLTIMLGKQELVFQCPTSGTGVWWEIFSYSSTADKLEIFNRITTSFA